MAHDLDIAELEFRLPPRLIAHEPAQDRPDSRLMLLDRGVPTPRGIARFGDVFLDQLRPDDVVVINNTRVLHARLHIKRPTGGRGELLLLEPTSEAPHAPWIAMARPAKRLRPDMPLTCPDGSEVIALEPAADGTWLVSLPVPGPEVASWLQRVGSVPLPPYINDYSGDPERYQTVFARSHGSVAAPTASLHFDAELLARLRAAAEVVELTLHVGAGTFKPVTADRLSQHIMHGERYDLAPAAHDAISAARAAGRRVVAIGTTVVRCLESIWSGPGRPLSGNTNLLIQPGYTFRCVDAMLTNFHLPKSTLLALVMAFHGIEATRAAYREAIAANLRFYSFGDAMWIG